MLSKQDLIGLQKKGPQYEVVVGDTQSDSIQYLNVAKKWFIQYSFTQDSIQNIIQLKKNLLIQFKSLFNSIVRGSLILVEWENCPKIARKVSKVDKKGGFSSKMANIDSKYDSDIYFTITFKGLLKIFFCQE